MLRSTLFVADERNKQLYLLHGCTHGCISTCAYIYNCHAHIHGCISPYTYTCSCGLPPSPRCSSPVLSCPPSPPLLSAPLLPTTLDSSHLLSVPPRFALLRPIRLLHHPLLASPLISSRRSSHLISAPILPIISSHLFSHLLRSSHRRSSPRLAFPFP